MRGRDFGVYWSQDRIYLTLKSGIALYSEA
jgi:hypothetical protein